MSRIALRGKLLRWGNSFGIRLSRRDVQRLHLAPGVEVQLHIDVDEVLQPSEAHAFHLGGTAADDHDSLFARSVTE